MGLAQLGDERLTARLVSLARSLALCPDATLPDALPEWRDLKAAYRFFDNPKAEPKHILAGHIQATWSRARAVPVVLAVQDTTYLDWTAHRATTGLGPLGNHLGSGIVCHSTLAVTPDRVPLGLMAQRNWVRDEQTFGSLTPHKKRAIKDKESIKWLESIDALAVARQTAPETTFVSVADREADVYELFAMERAPGVELLIRAAHNRSVDSPDLYLWETVQHAPELGTVEVTVPRRPGSPPRRCSLSLRSIEVTLKPPKARAHLGPIQIWAVLATEVMADDGDPIEWLLLTTVPTSGVQDAIERVHWYTCRWTIEVWHRVLKTGCRIESRQLESVDRLAVALTLYSIVAWRILYATMLSRIDPDLPCSTLLSKEEWQALYCNIHRVPEPTKDEPSLGQVVLWIAKLGGFLGRKGDGLPGPQVLWRGFQHLPYITDMFLIMRR